MRKYYPGRFNPSNRHDTGMYVVYRKSDGRYLGVITNCYSRSEALRKAGCAYGCAVRVSEIEE